MMNSGHFILPGIAASIAIFSGVGANAELFNSAKQQLKSATIEVAKKDDTGKEPRNIVTKSMLFSLPYSVVPDSEFDILVCYMQTADGRTLNLIELCGKSNDSKNSPQEEVRPSQEKVRELLATKQCQKCDLRGINLSGQNLGGANLTGTNLSGANLSGANLTGTNLSGANLTGANLSGVSMSNTDLSGANLRGASLSGSGWGRINLRGTTMPDGSIAVPAI